MFLEAFLDILNKYGKIIVHKKCIRKVSMEIVIKDYFGCSISNEDKIAFHIKDENKYTLDTHNLFDERLTFNVDDVVGFVSSWADKNDYEIEDITIELFKVDDDR